MVDSQGWSGPISSDRSLVMKPLSTVWMQTFSSVSAKRFNSALSSSLARCAATLEKVCVDTVEAGYMTKDLALLVGAEQKWLSTTGFLDKIDENLKKAMAG